jgi:hypothetical protein
MRLTAQEGQLWECARERWMDANGIESDSEEEEMQSDHVRKKPRFDSTRRPGIAHHKSSPMARSSSVQLWGSFTSGRRGSEGRIRQDF